MRCGLDESTLLFLPSQNFNSESVSKSFHSDPCVFNSISCISDSNPCYHIGTRLFTPSQCQIKVTRNRVDDTCALQLVNRSHVSYSDVAKNRAAQLRDRRSRFKLRLSKMDNFVSTLLEECGIED